MNSFQSITPEQLDPVFQKIGKDWMLISASDGTTANTMTASWGGLGVLWNKQVAVCLIRPERFTEEELSYIENAVNCNNSDFDLCDHGGKTLITYSWGNQYGKEFLALAEYDGSSEEFLKSFFE